MQDQAQNDQHDTDAQGHGISSLPAFGLFLDTSVFNTVSWRHLVFEFRYLGFDLLQHLTGEDAWLRPCLYPDGSLPLVARDHTRGVLNGNLCDGIERHLAIVSFNEGSAHAVQGLALPLRQTQHDRYLPISLPIARQMKSAVICVQRVGEGVVGNPGQIGVHRIHLHIELEPVCPPAVADIPSTSAVAKDILKLIAVMPQQCFIGKARTGQPVLDGSGNRCPQNQFVGNDTGPNDGLQVLFVPGIVDAGPCGTPDISHIVIDNRRIACIDQQRSIVGSVRAGIKSSVKSRASDADIGDHVGKAFDRIAFVIHRRCPATIRPGGVAQSAHQCFDLPGGLIGAVNRSIFRQPDIHDELRSV